MNGASLAELIARALWLVELPLVDERTAGAGPVSALRIRLAAMADMDDAVCRRIVERCFQPEPDLLANAAILSLHSCELHQGLPRFKADERLRALARLIDPDALVCLDARLRLADNDRYDWPSVPMGNGDNAAALLRQGSMDSHIHLGGVLPPLYYWVAAMSGQIPLEQIRLYPTDLKPGAEAREVWQKAMARALFLRLRLAAAMQAVFLRRGKRVFAHLPPLAWPDPVGKPGRGITLRWPDLLAMGQAPNWATIRDLALDLSRSQRFTLSAKQRAGFLVDPLRFDSGTGAERRHYAAGERCLLVHAARFLREGEEPNQRRCVAHDLLAYLRIRNAFHQKLAHDHGVDGLLSFDDSFSRRKFCSPKQRGLKPGQEAEALHPASRPRNRRRIRLLRLSVQMEQQRMATALDEQLSAAFADPAPHAVQPHAPLPVRRIEMRVTLPTGKPMLHVLRAWLNGIDAHIRPDPSQPFCRNSQVGLVFHFLKLADKEAQKEARRDRCQFQAEDHATRLCHLLAAYPQLRRYIVGIDAAGNERVAAPRQFASAYRLLRDCQAQLRNRQGEPGVQLGWTFHAGEDADDMLTALRHIDESVRLLLPPSGGGRLGHALLLGEPPREYYRDGRRETELALGTHLLDLVWAQGILAQHASPAHIPWLRERIVQYLGKQPANFAIDECYRRMWLDGATPGQGGHPRPAKTSGAGAVISESLLLKELGLEKKPQTPVCLAADEQWLDMLAEVQDLLRRELARRAIAVEANPTSNLIVGGYSRYRDLPYRILVEAGLPVSLNSDDPGLFISSLPGEFSAMYQALLVDMQHRQALRWLQERLDDGLQSSFLGLQVPVGQYLGQNGINAALRYR